MFSEIFFKVKFPFLSVLAPRISPAFTEAPGSGLPSSPSVIRPETDLCAWEGKINTTLKTSVNRQVVTFRIAMLSCYEQAGATYPFGSKKIKCETASNCNDLKSVKVNFQISYFQLSLPTPALSGSGTMGMISARSVGHPFEILCKVSSDNRRIQQKERFIVFFLSTNQDFGWCEEQR